MRVFLVVGLGMGLWSACGPAVPSPPSPSAARPGMPPPSDAAQLRRLLAGEVVNGGLWFADSACQAQFGAPGTVLPDAFDAFAHCVAGLHLRPTGRGDALDDTSVLTDDAGFEIEAHVVAGRLDFIGFSGRAPGAPALPSITPATLEALRAGGAPGATITADVASQVISPGYPLPTYTEHLRLCLGASGELTAVMPATTTMPAAAAAFAAVARGWSFRPFVVAGTPMAACATIGMRYPATSREPAITPLPRPPQRSKAGHLVYNVNPRDLDPLRVAGSKLVVPDDEDKIHLNGKRLVGSFRLCLDETGHYEQGTLLQSTGVAGYDAKIARAMMQWVYRPYVLDGVAIPVCTAATFIYTQR